jgi:hypothetical protein
MNLKLESWGGKGDVTLDATILSFYQLFLNYHPQSLHVDMSMSLKQIEVARRTAGDGLLELPTVPLHSRHMSVAFRARQR